MKATLDRDSVLTASPEQVSANLGSEGSEAFVILGLHDGVYYELRDVGARIWTLIQETNTFGAVLDVLLEEYEVDAAHCEADLVRLLTDLADRGLVRIERRSNFPPGER
jgi:hypothetical protein